MNKISPIIVKILFLDYDYVEIIVIPIYFAFSGIIRHLHFKALSNITKMQNFTKLRKEIKFNLLIIKMERQIGS